MKMSKFVTLLLTLCMSAAAFADTYVVDPSHSNVNFKIRHLLAHVNGRFTDFEGSFNFDEKMKATGQFKATIKAASINTDNQKRDTHLRSKDFFNAEKFPTIAFNGTTIKPTGDKTFQVTGDLTMVGQTKKLTFDFEYLGEMKDPTGAMKAGFVGKAKINRKDFGIVWNKALDGGNFLLGDEVEIEVLLEAQNTQRKSAAL